MRGFYRVLFLFVALFLCTAALHHECRHDAVQKRVFEEMNKRRVRGISTNVPYKDTKAGLKIHADMDALITPYYDVVNGKYRTCNSQNPKIRYGNDDAYVCTPDDMSTDKKREVVRKVVSYVMPLFEQFLSVYEIDGVMELDQGSYSDDICIGGINCFQGHTAGNIVSLSDEQLYVVVTMRPEEGNTYATGVSLFFDTHMRPIVGHINFNSRLMPSSISEKSSLWSELTGVALHEMMHVLGFSNSMFPFFLNSTSGELYDEPVLTDTNTEDGHTASVLATPRVVEAMRAQFGCDTLIGAPLEDQGGSGTAASHWEKAVFMDEVMTGSASSFPVLSNITLALLEDSGWYFPDYSHGERLLWGEGKGCNFVRAKCKTGWPRDETAGYFCTERDKEGCTYDRTARGLCSIKNYHNLPAEYRQLEDPTAGGTVVLADYCPFTRAYSNGLCSDTSTPTSFMSGDAVGEGSRCYMSKISLSPIDLVLDVKSTPLCYPTVCISAERFAVKIGNYWTECPAGKTLTSVHGYFGSLDCPDAVTMCGSTKSMFSTENKDYVPMPLLDSINPTTGKAGDIIEVCGENVNENVSIKLGAECINAKAINATCVSCEINTTSGFKTVFGIVDVTLSYGDYKTIYDNRFTVTLDLKAWAKRNAFFLFSILFSAILFILVLFTVIVKCHKTKKRYREYQARLRKAKAARAAKEQQAARGEVEMRPVS